MDYLPGTSILGLFAVNYIRKRDLNRAHEDDKFYRWFLKGDITFTNGYISKEKTNKKNIATYPTPLYIHKRKTDGEVYNIFLDEDITDTKPYGGFSNTSNGSITPIKIKKKISFHHERERLRGTSKEGLMFNYEALLPGQVFQGVIYGNHQDLLAFKNQFATNFKARMGKSKGTEYGHVQVALADVKKCDFAFDEENLEGEAFLTFTSPCIFYNACGLSDPSLANIKKYLEVFLGEDTFKIENFYLQEDIVETHLVIWGMKKPLERAIGAGSSVHLLYDSTDKKTRQGIRQLCQNGLGERLGEGFGRIEIKLAEEDIYYENEIENDIDKPTSQMPKEAKEIFLDVIQRAYLMHTQSIAVDNAREFNHPLPKNNLLGRLLLMLENGGRKAFLERLSQLKKRPFNQLCNCTNKKEELLNHIKKWNTEEIISRLKTSMASYDDLVELIDYDIKTEQKFQQLLWRKYMKTFLKELWWRNKQLSKEGEYSAKKQSTGFK